MLRWDKDGDQYHLRQKGTPICLDYSGLIRLACCACCVDAVRIVRGDLDPLDMKKMTAWAKSDASQS